LTAAVPESAVCPRCTQPFGPGADYCTHCGGNLGTAETALPYLPLPNSARFDEHHEAPPRASLPPWVQATGVFFCVWMFTGFAIQILAAAFGRDRGASSAAVIALTVAPLFGVVAGVLRYRRASASRD